MRITIGGKSLRNPVRIKTWDWLLVAGLSLAPMTGLRMWKIGPGEMICLIWGLRFLFTISIKDNDICRFFILFIPALGLGSIAGYIIAPNEVRINNLITWIYLGIIAISIYNGLRCNSKEYIERLLYIFAVSALAWYMFLFLYSRYINSYFLDAPLWYRGKRFSGGATNPHQVALLLCVLCFVFIRQLFLKKNYLVSLIGSAISVYLVLNTDSSTAVLSLALSAFLGVYFIIADFFGHNRSIVMIIMAVIIAIAVVINYDTFLDLFIRWVERDTNGLGRLAIFASFPSVFIKSPIVGLGPGVHGLNGLIEFHNMYLEVIAATGIFGGFVFFIFTIRLFKKMLYEDWKLLIIVVSMYAYGLAGFAMRRLVFWGIIGFVLAIAEQNDSTNRSAVNVNFSVLKEE